MSVVGAHCEIALTSEFVDVWLDRRLPFEATGDMLTLRTQLREAIRGLQCPKGSILCATYASADDSFCDIENILLYNVGPAVFAGSCGQGVRLVRSRMALHQNGQSTLELAKVLIAVPFGCTKRLPCS